MLYFKCFIFFVVFFCQVFVPGYLRNTVLQYYHVVLTIVLDGLYAGKVFFRVLLLKKYFWGALEITNSTDRRCAKSTPWDLPYLEFSETVKSLILNIVYRERGEREISVGHAIFSISWSFFRQFEPSRKMIVCFRGNFGSVLSWRCVVCVLASNCLSDMTNGHQIFVNWEL